MWKKSVQNGIFKHNYKSFFLSMTPANYSL